MSRLIMCSGARNTRERTRPGGLFHMSEVCFVINDKMEQLCSFISHMALLLCIPIEI